MQTWLPWRRTRGSLRSSSCLRRKPPRAPQLEETPETPPSWRAEGLLFLPGLESNPESSFQTEVRMDSLEATQWAPRDPRRGSRGERSPLLPLEARPDSPVESGVQSRDPCLPLRGLLCPGHTPKLGFLGLAVIRAQPPAFPRNSKGSLGFPGRIQDET